MEYKIGNQMFDLTGRNHWEANAPKRPHTSREFTHLEVHHGASSNSLAWEDPYKVVKGYQNYHQNEKNWNDIFYNLLLAPRNELIVGRGVQSRSVGTALTVCMLGNYSSTKISPNMLATLKLLAESTPHGLEGMTWHAERAEGTKYASSCPGASAIADLELLRTGAHVPVITPPKENGSMPSDGVSFEEALMIVNETYEKAWDRPGDAEGVIFWTERVMDEGFTAWVQLMRALANIGGE